MTAWPKDTQAARNAFYGDPGKGEIEAQLVRVTPPFGMTYEGKKVSYIRFHKKAAPALLAALNEVWDYCEHSQAKIDASGASKYFGAYEHRMVRGSKTKWSNHAYGTAIDLNALENALGQHGNMPAFIVDAFCRQGAMWGGWYKKRPDWMHFEFVDNGGHQPRSAKPIWPRAVVLSFMSQPKVSDEEFEDEPEEEPVPPTDVSAQSVTPSGTTKLNVQPVQKAYSVDVEITQTKLIGRGYPDVGGLEPGKGDGYWGGKTRGAITRFMNDRGKPVDGLMTEDGWTSRAAEQIVNEELSKAIAEGWTCPIAPSRANATAKDIAPKVASVNQTWWQKVWAYILGIPAAFMAGFKQLFGDSADPQSYFGMAKRAFSEVPLEVYLLGVVAIAIAIFVSAKRAQDATVAAYQKGEIN